MVDIAKTQAAMPLVAQLNMLNELIAVTQQAMSEHWLIMTLRMTSPDASKQLDLLPFGTASDDLSQLALTTALKKYQSMSDELSAQITAL